MYIVCCPGLASHRWRPLSSNVRFHIANPPPASSSMSTQSIHKVPSVAEVSSLTFDQLAEHLRLAKVNAGHYQHVRQALESELSARSPTLNYSCMKCQHGSYELHQIRATRTWLSSFFGVESAQYKAVVCSRCKFTEFYQGAVPLGQQALDFVFGK